MVKMPAFALPLPGEFNVHNALCAAAVGLEVGLNLKQIAAAMATIAIKGRFEAVDILPDVTFLIDYAHNGVSPARSGWKPCAVIIPRD